MRYLSELVRKPAFQRMTEFWKVLILSGEDCASSWNGSHENEGEILLLLHHVMRSLFNGGLDKPRSANEDL